MIRYPGIQAKLRRPAAKHGVAEDHAIAIGHAVRVTRHRSQALELLRGHAVRAGCGEQSLLIGPEPPERDASRPHQVCDGCGEAAVQLDIGRGGVQVIGDTQQGMQGLLLRLLGFRKEARVLERECRGERDLFEVVQVELREGHVGATADREDAEDSATGPERQDDAAAHI